MHVKFYLEKNATSVKVSDAVVEAFTQFSDKWEKEINAVKKIKILGLNEENIIVYRMSVTLEHPNESLLKILDALKDCIAENRIQSRKIIIGENSFFGRVRPNNKHSISAKEFKKAAQESDIDVLDHLIMANNSCYSFADNNYKLHEMIR